MYQSPITLYEGVTKSIIEERENEIILKVQTETGVDVDKEEMLRALKYDRNQYEKGYADGKADATPKWIPSREKLPTIEDADKYQRVLVVEHGMIALVNYKGPHNYPDKFPYWMPLSEMPKEGKWLKQPAEG